MLHSCDQVYGFFFFFKQKTAYELRISDWSSDVCSSDLRAREGREPRVAGARDLLDGARAAFGARLVERGGAHGEDELGVAGRHRRDRVARVDRAREAIGALDRQDVADLHHIEQRGDARIGRASWRERVCEYV